MHQLDPRRARVVGNPLNGGIGEASDYQTVKAQ